MPIMDKELLFGESIDLGSTSASATKISSNNVYLPKVKNHLGSSINQRPNVSGRLHLNIVVEDEAVAGSGGASAITFRLMAYTAAITASNLASASQVVEHPAISADASGANYPDGQQICSIPLPPGQIAPYLAVTAAVATKKVATGKVTAWIGPPIQQGT